MRPLAVLNAIIFGSATAISFGLLGVVVIFLVLKGSNPEMRGEFPALLKSSVVFVALAAVSGASLLAMLKTLKWRWLAQAAMWTVLGGIVLLYWPQ
jgi:hypothetical protein